MNIIVIENNKFYIDKLLFYLETLSSNRVVKLLSKSSDLIGLKEIDIADIVIIDLDISYTDGIEAAKKGLFFNKKLLFIAIASNSEGICLIDLISAGFRACVFKSQIYKLIDVLIKVLKNELCFPKEIKIK